MAVGRINELVALKGFPYGKMYGRFAGQKTTGRINEVAVRWGFTVVTKLPNGRTNQLLNNYWYCIVFGE